MIRVVDDATVRVYEARAKDWEAHRPAGRAEVATAFAARMADGAPRIDIGSGPGVYAPSLGRPLLALDATEAMVRRTHQLYPDVWAVRADLAAVPVRRGALHGAWARASYLHIPRADLPLALRELHRVLAVGAPVHLELLRGTYEGHALPDDSFPGRFFATWEPDALGDVVRGAGFDIDHLAMHEEWIVIDATRARTLGDSVGPGMRVLLVGLNPSLFSADVGLGFARPGNRFWPAALASGILTRDRDVDHALRAHRVGMTDLVKRATVGAAELSTAEYRDGRERLERLVAWLRPNAVCVIGLAGWRAAVDRRAVTGPQDVRLGGRPVYLMPNTSGLNARVTVAEFAQHFRDAAALADATPSLSDVR